ncbi:MAG: hypothetical protein FP814_16570 [Desulfobacterium sp.]|nr:hypothetical protein [Desulfobacterium sp.]MBU3947286.1 hypothetical protein [Pseudomonadota bacterium]MBU4036416.1 hypothetical protein [Pseudomonadota bacterium]
MRKRFWFITIIPALFFMFTACTEYNPTRLEMDYGTSVKLARFNQILYPEAEKKLDPVTGLDGEAAKAIMDKYHKGFEESKHETSYVFNLGGSSK